MHMYCGLVRRSGAVGDGEKLAIFNGICTLTFLGAKSNEKVLVQAVFNRKYDLLYSRHLKFNCQ